MVMQTRAEVSLESLADPLVPFVDVTAEYLRHKSAIDTAVGKVLAHGDFILGQAVGEFERAFARYIGTDHAVGVDSGFSALELIVRGMGIGPGDEVITQANTFVATVAAIEASGARPVLVDVDPETSHMDPQAFEAAITANTRAVIPVHLYGAPCDMGRIGAIARRHDLRVIEDACQAHGSRQSGRRAGSLGDAAAFSFYPSKNLGAAGDAGMIVTSDPELAERVRLLRNLGSAVKYEHEIRGFNRRMDTMHAALLLAKLPHLDSANASRRATARLLSSGLAELPISIPRERNGDEHVFHLYVIETDRREALQNRLTAAGISHGIHYPIPIHLQQAYRSLGYERGDFPVSESKAHRILSLPIFPHMDDVVVYRVIAAVRAFFEGR